MVFINSCDRSKSASLKFSYEQTKILLIEEECDVKSVYKSVNSVSLKKKVNIIRESNDWYKIIGDDTYVRTKMCFEGLFYDKKVTLELNEDQDTLGSTGQVIFESGNKCEILGIYKNLR